MRPSKRRDLLALKKAILHRKNALFYKTCHGAHVGDLFMSPICTCELCGANPFDYGKSPLEESTEGREPDRCSAEAAQGAVETHEGRAD